MKKALLLLSSFLVLFSCQKGEQGTFSSAESSNKHLLERFPMLGKELIKIKEVTMDTLSISIYKTPDGYYNKVVVFRKDNQFQSVPLFYNVYFDYWEYQEAQPQTAPKTGTTFDKEIKSVFRNLKLSRDEENNIREELMKSVLNTETFLDEKPQLFVDTIYSTDFNDSQGYDVKPEEEDSCLVRTQKIYQYILNESRKTIRNKAFYLDREHSRVYEWVYDSEKPYPLSHIKVHRLSCFSYKLEI